MSQSRPCTLPSSWGEGEAVELPPQLAGWRFERSGSRADVNVIVRRYANGVLELSASDSLGGPLRLVAPLRDDEHVAGFGEQFGELDLRGRIIDGWSEDLLQTHPRGTYFPAPVWHSSRGHAAIVDTFSRYRADIGATVTDELAVDVPEGAVRAWVLPGPPKETLPRLMELTGRPTSTPAWAYGVWSSARSGTKAVLDDCERLVAERLPVTAVWVDDPWIPDDNFGCGAPGTYPKGDYPNPQELVEGIHDRGLKALGYLNCALYADTPWDDEADDAGYHVSMGTGQPYRYHFFHPAKQQGGMLAFEDDVAGSVDFTNPQAVTWWRGKIRSLISTGWDGWMQDFGEQIPEQALMADGSTGNEAHNRYPLHYHAATNAERLRGAEDRLFFVRAGYLGAQQHAPVMWGGDQSIDWLPARGLPSVLMGGVSAGLSGMPVWSPDVVGIVELPYPGEEAGADFLDRPETPNERGLDKELWLRWLEYGALTPILRIHLGFKPRAGNPVDVWTDDDTVDAFRRWSHFHLRLFPYLHSLGRAAADTGVSILRGMMVEFPGDPRCWEVDDQYLLGDAILVAPVVERGATSRSVYFPAGTWEHLLTGDRFLGPGDHVVAAPVGQIPVFQRAGTILPLLPTELVVVGDALTGPRWELGDFPVQLRVVDRGRAETELFEGTRVTVRDDVLEVESVTARTYSVIRGGREVASVPEPVRGGTFGPSTSEGS